jgi:hypothetical protein
MLVVMIDNPFLGLGIVFGGAMVRSAEAAKWEREYRAARRKLLKYSPSCAYCGEGYATTADHIMPRSRGGGNEPENLAAACSTCNTEKLDFTPAEWEAWRKEKGLPWPPISRTAFVMAALRDDLDRRLEMERQRSA